MFGLGLGDWSVVVGLLISIVVGLRWEWSTKYKRAIEERDRLKVWLADAELELGRYRGQTDVEIVGEDKRPTMDAQIVGEDTRPTLRERAGEIELDADEIAFLHSAVLDKWRVSGFDSHMNKLNKNRLAEKDLLSSGTMSMYVNELGQEVYELYKDKIG